MTSITKWKRSSLLSNVMSKAVDWENDALYHPDPGVVLGYIGRNLTRHFVLRNDYGFHETTCYLYRAPAGVDSAATEAVP